MKGEINVALSIEQIKSITFALCVVHHSNGVPSIKKNTKDLIDYIEGIKK